MPSGPVVRVALAQLNCVVGDIATNRARIERAIAASADAEADLVITPELALTGYPPEDLLLKEHFLADTREALEGLAVSCHEIVAIVGFPERDIDVFNTAAVLASGAVQGLYRKIYLPNYGVFDEQRYFQSGEQAGVFDLGEARIGVTICEDIWEPGPPASDTAAAGASLLVNLSASPYHAGKGLERERMVMQRARDNLMTVAFCNLVGGQDELVFDGHSMVVDHRGELLGRAAQFCEDLLVCDVDLGSARAQRLRDGRLRPSSRRSRPRAQSLAELRCQPPRRAAAEQRVSPLIEPLDEEVYQALALGLHDYAIKNGFDRVVLGLSGGIDSALVACIAVDALGPDAVTVAIMPSPYSSQETQQDARTLAAHLGVNALEIEISQAMDAYQRLLEPVFAGRPRDVAEENLQARVRGNLLMALSNKFGWLVLTTGNKSELSVGYATLYGDLAGGFAVLKDVPKTLVYRLAHQRNARGSGNGPIPGAILERAPSAELRPGQRDQDSLPPYEVLDRILHGYVELDQGRDQLLAQGLAASAIEDTIRLVDLAEYKRRQAPPGMKITPRAFGRDRRMPITNRYRG